MAIIYHYLFKIMKKKKLESILDNFYNNNITKQQAYNQILTLFIKNKKEDKFCICGNPSGNVCGSWSDFKNVRCFDCNKPYKI
jgi:hypothetical protein